MKLQNISLPKRQLPWLLTSLSEAILRFGGTSQEGIFRIAADNEDIARFRLQLDCVDWSRAPPSDVTSLMNGELVDVNILACVLKSWLRELPDPLIPFSLYHEALHVAESPQGACALVTEKMPPTGQNRLVLGYLLRFLQVFAATEHSQHTRMDQSNLAMVWAPNVLRAPPHLAPANPQAILDNTRREMTLVRTLIEHLDTSFIAGVV